MANQRTAQDAMVGHVGWESGWWSGADKLTRLCLVAERPFLLFNSRNRP